LHFDLSETGFFKSQTFERNVENCEKRPKQNSKACRQAALPTIFQPKTPDCQLKMPEKYKNFGFVFM
jgi:hypothetical protein